MKDVQLCMRCIPTTKHEYTRLRLPNTATACARAHVSIPSHFRQKIDIKLYTYMLTCLPVKLADFSSIDLESIYFCVKCGTDTSRHPARISEQQCIAQLGVSSPSRTHRSWLSRIIVACGSNRCDSEGFGSAAYLQCADLVCMYPAAHATRNCTKLHNDITVVQHFRFIYTFDCCSSRNVPPLLSSQDNLGNNSRAFYAEVGRSGNYEENA